MKETVDMPHTQAVEPNIIPGRFLGRVAVVTGGAQGIGAAVALRLTREGARVVLADIDGQAMQATARKIAMDGGCVELIACDVRRRCEVEEMVGHAADIMGHIDILIHSAGVCRPVAFIETDESLWNETLDTNLKGAYLVSRSVVPHMIRRGGGSLVFIASTNSYEGEMMQAPYNASKGGLYLLSKTLARELGPYGIRSNSVGPGFIRTRLSEPFLREAAFINKYLNPDDPAIPLGRFGVPEDVTGPVLFLASDDAAFVNGAMLLVDGGQLA
ncbi:MAG: SDR family oxidoreductase [Candidatus Omnitrophica bacterium]|nr:SDR family oxidoreductase [Candidatus Omnitrophota bacterium]